MGVEGLFDEQILLAVALKRFEVSRMSGLQAPISGEDLSRTGSS